MLHNLHFNLLIFTMQIKLHTIIIFARDVEALKQFYVGILELEIIEEYPSEWVLLQVGACHIGLHKIGNEYLKEMGESFSAENNIKLVFEINEDILTIRQMLLDKGVAMREMKTFDNYDFFMCNGEDPEGNVFQLKRKMRT